MRILITGATGFIGQNLVATLANSNELLLYTRRDRDYLELGGCRIKNIFGTFSVDEDYREITQGVDIVYHLISTSIPNNSNDDIAKEITDNVLATIKLLDGCIKSGVKKVIFISSGGTVYGSTNSLPLRESDGNLPISGYGLQKLTIEKVLYLYNYLHGLDYRIIRLSNPYGPYQIPNGVQGVVTTFIDRVQRDKKIYVYGDGSIIRDYIYIDDAINAIIKIANYKGGEKVFNVGSGIGLSINDVINIIEKVLELKADVEYKDARKTDVPSNILCIERYIRELGQLVFTSFDEGIQKTANFLKEISNE